MRLIDADALKELRHKYIQGQLNFDGNEYDLIDMCPTVYARYGEWIPQDETYTKFMCSECNFKNYEGYEKYCPNCGAKMDGE